jgi:hypothetical protein
MAQKDRSPGPALLRRADAAAAAVRALPPRAGSAREMRRGRRAEIFASSALAGSHLKADEVDALLDAGLAQGNHPFTDYILVRAYADAASAVAEMRTTPAHERRPLIAIEELRGLNSRVVAGASLRGGAWRQANSPPDASVVAPAAWLVARETAALADRFGRGPGGEPTALWLARFIGRFARLRPFADGNGRTARLAANLLLRRLDFPPLVLERRERSRYERAVAAAEANEPLALAALFGAALLRTANRLGAAGEAQPEPVLALREAAGDDYAALAKAAQRGRLRTIVRGGRYFTTARWVAQYRDERNRRQTTRPSGPMSPPAHPVS